MAQAVFMLEMLSFAFRSGGDNATKFRDVFGMHALDHMRSEFVTNLLTQAVDGAVRKLPKRRAIVLRGHVIPYNAPADEWPEELRQMMKRGAIEDDLGGAPPTREALAAIYGAEFANMVVDDALTSTPSRASRIRTSKRS